MENLSGVTLAYITALNELTEKNLELISSGYVTEEGKEIILASINKANDTLNATIEELSIT